jgi:uncharacterized membrane-anchored protein YhcB (DUF1043 family)
VSPVPWYRKFLDNPPPMPDRIWAYVLMGLLILVGWLLGMVYCVVTQAHAPTLTTPALQEQLDRLEQRLRARDHR